MPTERHPTDLPTLLRHKLESFDPQAIEPSATRLRTIVGDRAEAILAYGSCLSEVTRSASSTPDFYVVVKRYRDFHRSVLHRILNRTLPPNIYHFFVDGRPSKYSVICFPDLTHETSPRARDVYQLGRFSKRMAVAWARDGKTREEIVAIQASAMRTVAGKVYHLVPDRFTIDQFAKEALALSYYGDVRVEADDKIDRLFEAEEEFFRDAYTLILDELTRPPWLLKKNLTNGSYEKTRDPWGDRVGKLRLRNFLLSSRIRAQLRWPKGIFTVENWVNYLIRKIERTHGVRIEMTERQKRFWFIYGWKHFFRLRRKKLIR